jgi:hypothetical protein
VLDDPSAEEKTWTELNTAGLESPQSLSLKDNHTVAFVFLEEEEQEPAFMVEWSSYDDYFEDDGQGLEEDE